MMIFKAKIWLRTEWQSTISELKIKTTITTKDNDYNKKLHIA